MGTNQTSIAKVQTQDRNVNQLQQNVTQAVNPVLKNPIVFGTILTNVQLTAGTNTISHGLGRTLQGWFEVRKRADASIYDNQDSNGSPAQTLILVSDVAVSINLYVF